MTLCSHGADSRRLAAYVMKCEPQMLHGVELLCSHLLDFSPLSFGSQKKVNFMVKECNLKSGQVLHTILKAGAEGNQNQGGKCSVHLRFHTASVNPAALFYRSLNREKHLCAAGFLVLHSFSSSAGDRELGSHRVRAGRCCPEAS